MFKNYIDWTISRKAPNRRIFNDYPVREYTASDWQWKWCASFYEDEDIVYSYMKV